MSTLFSISGSWHSGVWLYEKLAFAKTGDSILLLQDAVLAAHSPLTLASFLAKCQAASVAVFLLTEDVVLRGVENKYPEIDMVDYGGFIELVAKHDKHVAW